MIEFHLRALQMTWCRQCSSDNLSPPPRAVDLQAVLHYFNLTICLLAHTAYLVMIPLDLSDFDSIHGGHWSH